MPSRHPQDQPADAPSFWEAIAQWQLSLRTAVKSTSSLPSAVFHACDATLEAQLAESTEGMLARLLEPPPEVVQVHPDGERRIESVATDELRSLPARLAGADGPGAADLDDRLRAETLAVLTDVCCSDPEEAARAAAAALQRHFGARPDDDPLAVAGQLTETPARSRCRRRCRRGALPAHRRHPRPADPRSAGTRR